MDRRSLLLGIGSTVALGSVARAISPTKIPARGPRYFVQLLPGGGLDAIFTTDPKRRSEVESWVDVPYEPDAIVSKPGGELGPHFAPWAGRYGSLAVVNGIRSSTANHQTGIQYASRLRNGVTADVPTLFDILGAHRDGQPLSSVYLNALLVQEYQGGSWFGTPTSFVTNGAKNVFDHADGLDSDALGRLSRVMAKHSSEVRGISPAGNVTAANLSQVSALFERMRTVPRFKAEIWSDQAGAQEMAVNLQRTLWVLENDLARCSLVNLARGLDWDSHYLNTARQTALNATLVSLVGRFLDELEIRSGAAGPLASSTAVILGAEIGRHPRLNDALGKDHFPEVPYVFSGPWFQGGHTFGKTGRAMESGRVSLKTGRSESNGHALQLDDLGTTILRLAGLDPDVYGYTGRPLDFLLRETE